MTIPSCFWDRVIAASLWLILAPYIRLQSWSPMSTYIQKIAATHAPLLIGFMIPKFFLLQIPMVDWWFGIVNPLWYRYHRIFTRSLNFLFFHFATMSMAMAMPSVPFYMRRPWYARLAKCRARPFFLSSRVHMHRRVLKFVTWGRDLRPIY